MLPPNSIWCDRMSYSRRCREERSPIVWYRKCSLAAGRRLICRSIGERSFCTIEKPTKVQSHIRCRKPKDVWETYLEIAQVSKMTDLNLSVGIRKSLWEGNTKAWKGSVDKPIVHLKCLWGSNISNCIWT